MTVVFPFMSFPCRCCAVAFGNHCDGIGQQLLGARRAASAAIADAQTPGQVFGSAGTVLGGLDDLALRDAVAQADVHGVGCSAITNKNDSHYGIRTVGLQGAVPRDAKILRWINILQNPIGGVGVWGRLRHWRRQHISGIL
jgi:hypothetical protein